MPKVGEGQKGRERETLVVCREGEERRGEEGRAGHLLATTFSFKLSVSFPTFSSFFSFPLGGGRTTLTFQAGG